MKQLAGTHAFPVLIMRGDDKLPVEEGLEAREGDRITWLAPLTEKDMLADLCQTITPSIKRFYGDFTVRGDARVADLAMAYGLTDLNERLMSLSVAQLFARQVGGRPVEGDILFLGGLRLRVRSMDGERVHQVGIRLPR